MSTNNDSTKTYVAISTIVTVSVVIACFCFLMMRLDRIEAASSRAEAISVSTNESLTNLARSLADYIEQSNELLRGN